MDSVVMRKSVRPGPGGRGGGGHGGAGAAMRQALGGRSFDEQSAMLAPAEHHPYDRKKMTSTATGAALTPDGHAALTPLEDLARLEGAPVVRRKQRIKGQAHGLSRPRPVWIDVELSLSPRAYYDHLVREARDAGRPKPTVDETIAGVAAYCDAEQCNAYEAVSVMREIARQHPDVALHELPVAAFFAAGKAFAPFRLEHIALSRYEVEGPDVLAEPLRPVYREADPDLSFSEVELRIVVDDWNPDAVGERSPEQYRASLEERIASFIGEEVDFNRRFYRRRTDRPAIEEALLSMLRRRLTEGTEFRQETLFLKGELDLGAISIARVAWTEQTVDDHTKMKELFLMSPLGGVELPYGNGRLPLTVLGHARLVETGEGAEPPADVREGLTTALCQAVVAEAAALAPGARYMLDVAALAARVRERSNRWLEPMGLRVQALTEVEAQLYSGAPLTGLVVPEPDATPVGLDGEVALDGDGSLAVLGAARHDQTANGNINGGNYTNALLGKVHGGKDVRGAGAELEGIKLGSQIPQFSIAVGGDSEAPAARRAAVVGNEQYPGLSWVAGAHNDAYNFGGLLRGRGYEVKTQLDLKGAAIDTSFRDAVARSQDGDAVTLYFAGHGSDNGGLVGIDRVDMAWNTLVALATSGANKGADVDVVMDACYAGQANQRVRKAIEETAKARATSDPRIDEARRFVVGARTVIDKLLPTHASYTLQSIWLRGLRGRMAEAGNVLEDLGAGTAAKWHGELDAAMGAGNVYSVLMALLGVLTRMAEEIERVAAERGSDRRRRPVARGDRARGGSW